MDKRGTKSTLILWLLVALLYEEIEAGVDCTNDADCSDLNARCDSGGTGKCSCKDDYTQQDNTCKANKGIGEVCSAADDTCTTLGTACVGEGGSSSTTKCLCDADYVANEDSKACLKKLGTSCGSTTECAGDGVCDTNSDSSTCAIGSGGTCTAADSKCVAHSECIGTKCTCTHGGADESTKLCPAHSGVVLGESCTKDSDCTGSVANSVCVDDKGLKTCSCAVGYIQRETECKANKLIGVACSTTSDVCTTVGTACVDDGGGTSTTKCLCDGDYVANADDSACLKNLGTSCGSTTVCAEDNVCDFNSDSPTCAIGSGGTCNAADSKCVAHSECTESKCTCANGDTDESTKLCPAPSGGFRETSSMLVVTVCLWLSLF